MKETPDLTLSLEHNTPFQIRFKDKFMHYYDVEVRAVDIIEIVARHSSERDGLIETTGYLDLKRAK